MKPLDASDWPRLIRPGSRVFIGGGASVPFALVESMLSMAAGFKDVELVHIHGLGETPWIAPKYEQVLRTNSFYLTPALRDAVERGQADYTPCAMSEVASLFKTGPLPLDVALIQVSPPDAEGFCSLGVSVDIVNVRGEVRAGGDRADESENAADLRGYAGFDAEDRTGSSSGRRRCRKRSWGFSTSGTSGSAGTRRS